MTPVTKTYQIAFATTSNMTLGKSMASPASMSTGRDCHPQHDDNHAAVQDQICAWRAAHIDDTDETIIVTVDTDACRVIKTQNLSSCCQDWCLGETFAQIPHFGLQPHDSNGDTGSIFSNLMTCTDTVLHPVTDNGMIQLYPQNLSAQACVTFSTFILKEACVPVVVVLGLVPLARLPTTFRPADRSSRRRCRGDPERILNLCCHPELTEDYGKCYRAPKGTRLHRYCPIGHKKGGRLILISCEPSWFADNCLILHNYCPIKH